MWRYPLSFLENIDKNSNWREKVHEKLNHLQQQRQKDDDSKEDKHHHSFEYLFPSN